MLIRKKPEALKSKKELKSAPPPPAKTSLYNSRCAQEPRGAKAQAEGHQKGEVQGQDGPAGLLQVPLEVEVSGVRGTDRGQLRPVHGVHGDRLEGDWLQRERGRGGGGLR